MTPWQRYQTLLAENPKLFRNDAAGGGIRIVSDAEVILADQARLAVDPLLARPQEPHELGVLVEDPWFWIIRDWVEFPSGGRGGYLRVVSRKRAEGGHGVAVLARRGHEVLLIRVYRHALRDWAWEIPRGFGEPGLSAEGNARKELLEETGLAATSLTRLGSLCPDSGTLDELTSLFLAEIDPAATPAAEVGEASEVITGAQFVGLGRLESMIADGALTDSFTIAAYAMARSKGLLSPA